MAYASYDDIPATWKADEDALVTAITNIFPSPKPKVSAEIFPESSDSWDDLYQDAETVTLQEPYSVIYVTYKGDRYADIGDTRNALQIPTAEFYIWLFSKERRGGDYNLYRMIYATLIAAKSSGFSLTNVGPAPIKDKDTGLWPALLIASKKYKLFPQGINA